MRFDREHFDCDRAFAPRLPRLQKDILMNVFPDALSLGSALEAMEREAAQAACEGVEASLAVISCLAQATRKAVSQQALEEALLLLGSVGIRPDADTIDYFRRS